MEARGGTKRQLFGIFLAFSESSHQMGPEKPLGARKSQKVAKWVTLMLPSRVLKWPLQYYIGPSLRAACIALEGGQTADCGWVR